MAEIDEFLGLDWCCVCGFVNSFDGDFFLAWFVGGSDGGVLAWFELMLLLLLLLCFFFFFF